MEQDAIRRKSPVKFAENTDLRQQPLWKLKAAADLLNCHLEHTGEGIVITPNKPYATIEKTEKW